MFSYRKAYCYTHQLSLHKSADSTQLYTKARNDFSQDLRIWFTDISAYGNSQGQEWLWYPREEQWQMRTCSAKRDDVLLIVTNKL